MYKRQIYMYVGSPESCSSLHYQANRVEAGQTRSLEPKGGPHYGTSHQLETRPSGSSSQLEIRRRADYGRGGPMSRFRFRTRSQLVSQPGLHFCPLQPPRARMTRIARSDHRTQIPAAGHAVDARTFHSPADSGCNYCIYVSAASPPPAPPCVFTQQAVNPAAGLVIAIDRPIGPPTHRHAIPYPP
jgi:hypothetical protein